MSQKKCDLPRLLVQKCTIFRATLVWLFFNIFWNFLFFWHSNCQKNPWTFFSLEIRLNHRITENWQNCNKKILKFQFWSNFKEKLFFNGSSSFNWTPYFLTFENILRRKELENSHSFSSKIRPKLKIANFPITIVNIHIFAFLNLDH